MPEHTQPTVRIGLSTSSVYPLDVEAGFQLAQAAGYDGVEVMVTRDRRTQSVEELQKLVDRYDMPVLSIHAPVLLLTHFVWGTDPQVKLERTTQLARDIGASTVVVHPPFRWQSGYAEHFLRLVAEISDKYQTTIAVENMFPWRVKGKSVAAYAPGWDVTEFDCTAVTLDFSHAALSGQNSLELCTELGDRLAHVHLCDGSSSLEEGKVFDEHLIPGRGKQPVAQVLQQLAQRHWTGNIVAEINTRKAKTEAERLELLAETLNFAREHLDGHSGLSSPKH